MMDAPSPGVAIIGVSQTPVVRRTEGNLAGPAIDACLGAIRDAGLERDQIDGYCGIPEPRHGGARHADGVDEVSATFMAQSLGLRRLRWSLDLHNNMATALLVTAAQALLAGTCEYALILRAVYNPSHRSYSQVSAVEAAGTAQFELPYGIGPGGARFAQWLRRYMWDTGATRESLFEIARAARSNAQSNELAIWRGSAELGLGEYLSSRWVSEPMCIHDCDMPVTSAVAMVLTTSAKARTLRLNPAHLLSWANGWSPERVLASAGLTHGDIDVAQLYDGFSPLIWLWLERLGFCRTGEAHLFTSAGQLRPGGSLPVNTFGGSLGEGRLHGMGHVREAALQAMGRCGDRQVGAAPTSLAVVGIPENFWSVIFRSDPQG